MKLVISLLFVILFNLINRENIVGEYYNYFGQTLILNKDSTFIYTFNFHNSGSWTKGKWKSNNDTIYLKIVLVFDTIRFSGKKDTLILSLDHEPELITEKNVSITHYVSSYRQNDRKIEDILYFKNEKLYLLDKWGRLINKKKSGKLDTYFIRKEE